MVYYQSENSDRRQHAILDLLDRHPINLEENYIRPTYKKYVLQTGLQVRQREATTSKIVKYIPGEKEKKKIH